MKDLVTLRDQYVKATQKTVDYDKFNQFSIVHHSNAIEGSTLTKVETNLLLDKNITPGGKPLQHSLMAVDHLQALKFTMKLAENKVPLSVENIQQLSALILKSSHGPMETAVGNFDPSKGEFRTVRVFAGNVSFPKAERVPDLTEKLITEINASIEKVKGFEQINRLAFQAHYQLVNIHPFIDGNGRLSRLLMNYVQHYHKEPLTLVNSSDKALYIEALDKTRNLKDLKVFEKFMFGQAGKFFKAQLKILNQAFKIISKGTDTGISFIF